MKTKDDDANDEGVRCGVTPRKTDNRIAVKSTAETWRNIAIFAKHGDYAQIGRLMRLYSVQGQILPALALRERQENKIIFGCLPCREALEQRAQCRIRTGHLSSLARGNLTRACRRHERCSCHWINIYVRRPVGE
jgi:hypothetical protein